jgi:hypothetical protein
LEKTTKKEKFDMHFTSLEIFLDYVSRNGPEFGGDLNLTGCTGLTTLPEGLNVGGSLNLTGCTGLTALPEGLYVGSILLLVGCTGLTALPEGMNVGGTLYLDGCTGLTALPEGLNVGGDLYLTGCTGLTALPEGMNVGCNLHLSGCTGLTREFLDRFPKIENIHQKVYAAASVQGAFDMKTWHCNTTHCRAGWVTELAGLAHSDMEKRLSVPGLAALIYRASDPDLINIPNFYCDNETALADMKHMAEQERVS